MRTRRSISFWTKLFELSFGAEKFKSFEDYFALTPDIRAFRLFTSLPGGPPWSEVAGAVMETLFKVDTQNA